jgi:hypothetical protein
MPQEGLAMSKLSATKDLTAILSIATIAAAISFGPARAEDKGVTEDQIVRALAPEKKPLTRGLSVGPQQAVDPAAVAAEGKFVQKISAKSLPSVQALGRALTNDGLKGSTFVVAGHTDAAGGEAYNQDLSERRADAIKRYLVDKHGINGSDLVTVGYGKTKLKDPNQPLAEVNRRVQVVNMENKATASNASK